MTGDAIGGVWTYALELARGLAPYNIEVTLATMGGPLAASQCQEAAAITNLQVHASSWKLEWMDNPWDDLPRAGDWLLGLEQALAPDLIHLNTYVHGALPWRAAALLVGAFLCFILVGGGEGPAGAPLLGAVPAGGAARPGRRRPGDCPLAVHAAPVARTLRAFARCPGYL